MDVSIEELLVGVERDFTNRQIWSQVLANKFADDVELHSIELDNVMRSVHVILDSLVVCIHIILIFIIIINYYYYFIINIIYLLTLYLSIDSGFLFGIH